LIGALLYYFEAFAYNEYMRKIIVLEHLSIDGVIQAPGGRKEDTSGGFKYGGWSAPYENEILGEVLKKMLEGPLDLLLGRKTFDIWEGYWPQHSDYWPAVMTATKYVVSNTRTSSEWQPSVFLGGDIAEKISAIKQEDGPDIHVWGSGELVQTLLKNDLVDTLWLMIYPVTLGDGKRLFAGGAIPAAFEVTESTVTPNGVVQVVYDRAGDVETGDIEA
jgi:dihydrofolate reductase